MTKIYLEKKYVLAIIVGAFLVVVILIFFFVYAPLVSRSQRLTKEINEIENDIKSADDRIIAHGEKNNFDRLIGQDKIVMTLDEITKEGRSFGISFFSITPKESERTEGVPYGRLPIELTLESRYKDLGSFLGTLRQYEKSIITVKSFNIQRKEEILPLLRARLVLEVYLRDDR